MGKRIASILSQMTLEEKIALCSGQDSWHTKVLERFGVSGIMMTDGPHGLRKQYYASNLENLNESVPATCFPAAVSTGSSWDVKLLEQMGRAMGEEALEQGVSLILGPGLNIKRNPLCGRNFEYFSEDPILSGKMAGGLIRGIQSQGVGACMKHFAANNQEYKRFTSDSVADERTLREIYLAGFEIAAKGGKPRSVMCGYNRLNGTHCSENHWLLTRILREEWGWDGMVVSDWGAMVDRVESFRAGCDLNMPGGSDFMEAEALRQVKSGKLAPEAVDRAAGRVLKLMLQSQPARRSQPAFDREAHHQLAREIAGRSAVLLKNEGGVLPLKEGQRVALIGDMAKNFRYQGAGSSHINPTRLTSLYEALEAENEDLRAKVAELERSARTTDALQRENQRLEALTGLKQEREDFQLVSAYVITWDSNDWTSSFTINKGSRSGIAVDMVVITAQKEVVGLVTEVGANWATVTTVLDSSLEISANIASSGHKGMVQGAYTTGSEGMLRMDYLPTDAVIRNNDQVVTAGSTLYPRDLILGYVANAGFNATGVSKFAILTPAADFGELEQVYILTDYVNE